MTTSDILDCSQRSDQHHYSRHDVPCKHPVGPLDTEPISVVLERLPQIPGWQKHSKGPTYLKRARRLLEWLAQHDGDGWQARWEAANGDSYDWVDNLTSGSLHLRKTMVAALRFLLLARVIRPSYVFFTRFSAHGLFDQAQQVFDPAVFAHLGQIATDLGMPTFMFNEGRKTIVKIVLHTGKNVDALTEQDFFEFREFQLKHWGETKPGLASGWDLLRVAGVLPVTGSLIEMLRRGQRPTAELVDLYDLQRRQRGRLVEIIHNLGERIQDAKLNGWLGEVRGLQTSLEAAKKELVGLDRGIQRNHANGPTLLGIPTIGPTPPPS
ncbi:hypothetical protein AB0L13_45590 [Saccharopolyspora shandongensis]|uniref:hypothetical protein n=1 Tax=Saccharopolyspora shandongensis TaxID=418495 RepID=UPI0034385B70